MKGFRPSRPSPALVVSVIALVAALGGTSYAALSLPKNSVGTKQLKNNAVTTKKIKNGAVTGSKIANNTITGGKIKLSTVGTVPSANHANSANNATNATNATTAATAGSANSATGLAGPLASAQTLRGTFGVAGHKAATAASFVSEQGVTFQLPLAASPAFNYVAPGGASTAQCPGSFNNPTASAGQVCFYAQNQVGASGLSTLAFTPNKFGVIVFPTGVAANADYEVDGNWAVTAP
jgi:hypothetical protein